MPILSGMLELDRCPHCGSDKPTLQQFWVGAETISHDKKHRRFWRIYRCTRCGGVVSASGSGPDQPAQEIFPNIEIVHNSISSPAREYLQQAIESKHAPAGCLMLCNSAVDAMLKKHGYDEGHIHERIDKAVKDNLLTSEMGKWAHKVRIDSNFPRHADTTNPLPTLEDAERAIQFAKALGDFLFVIPELIEDEIKKIEDKDNKPNTN